MRKLSTYILSILLVSFAFLGHAQQLEWAYSLINTDVQDNAKFIASNGTNFAICGKVHPNESYDFINQNPAFSGAMSFVAYYNANAEIQWMVAQPPDGYFERVSTMYIDESGALFVVGRFSGTIDFDPGPGTYELTANLSDVYVQKFDNAGNFLWVGHTNCDGEPRKVAMKSNGNLVVVGRLQDTTTAYLYNGTPRPLEKGVYLLEFAANGDAVAAYSIATPDSFNDQTAIAVDDNDNVYVGCSVAGNMDLDLKAGILAETSNSSYDCVLAKYDANYDYVWHKRFGDLQTGAPDGWDFINDLKFDNGFLYATGWFTWTTDFDPDDNPGQWVYTAGTGSQTPDGFLVKYNPDGVIQWIQEAGGHPSISTNTDVWYYEMVIENGQIIVSGELNGAADFDGSVNDFIVTTPDNGLALCYAHYDIDGNFLNTWLINGPLANEAHRGIEPLGNGIVAYGTFQKQCDFDPTANEFLLSTDTTGQFYWADNDVFVAHYTIDGIGGMNDLEETQVLAYPNPTSGMVYLQSTLDVGEIEIRNITGVLIARQTGNYLDLSAQPSGVYFLSTASGQTLRIVKD